MSHRIVYFSPYDLLRPRTNQVSDVRFCEAFAENDVEVLLVVPQIDRPDNLSKTGILEKYDVKQSFPVHYLNKHYPNENLSKKNYLYLSFLCLQALRHHFTDKDPVFIISRSEILLLFTLLYKKLFFKKNWKVVPWLHELKTGFLHRWVYKNASCILATNSSIAKDLRLLIGKPDLPCGISLNPISEAQKQEKISKEQARIHINYQDKKPLIVYTGKLYIGQPEIAYLIEAAAALPHYHFIFTGGKPEVLEHYQMLFEQRNIRNISLTGYLADYSQIKYYQRAADLLLSYYTAKEHDVRYNFPNKICEYMLSGNPVLTPFFPATADILSEENAFEVKPDDAKALQTGIESVFSKPEEMQRRAKNALQLVHQLTYKNKAAALLKVLINGN